MFILIIIGIGLSMDAFSLSLSYATKRISKFNTILLSLIVGIYHFFMPIIGMNVGKKITKLLPFSENILIFIILFFIGLEMIIETFKQKEEYNTLHFIEMLVFGFAVSIDSFSLGISIKTIYNDVLVSSLTFSVISYIFTFLGLKIGNYINKKIGKISTLLGGIILILIGLSYIV